MAVLCDLGDLTAFLGEVMLDAPCNNYCMMREIAQEAALRRQFIRADAATFVQSPQRVRMGSQRSVSGNISNQFGAGSLSHRILFIRLLGTAKSAAGVLDIGGDRAP
jgi:hypothetical protein